MTTPGRSLRWKRGEIQSLIRRARNVGRFTSFDMKAALPEKARPRIVTVIPKKIGDAPTRNRCRRRLKELIRTLVWPNLPVDIVIFVRVSIATTPQQELIKAIEQSRDTIAKFYSHTPGTS